MLPARTPILSGDGLSVSPGMELLRSLTMILELNKAAREATERDIEGWHMTNGTPPGMKKGTMLCIMSGSGRPYAIGCGSTDLEAVNALVDDMTKRARKWIDLRRTVRVWRDALRIAAGEDRAAKSTAFLASKRSPSNAEPMRGQPLK